MNIIKAIEDPKLFGPLFPDLTSWKVWILCLKAIFALPMYKDERRIYRKRNELRQRFKGGKKMAKDFEPPQKEKVIKLQ